MFDLLHNFLVGVWALRYWLLFLVSVAGVLGAARLWVVLGDELAYSTNLEIQLATQDRELADLRRMALHPPAAADTIDPDVTLADSGYVADRLPHWLPPDVVDLSRQVPTQRDGSDR